VSALDDAIEAACGRALAKHRDAQHAELLERLERIESRLGPLLARPARAAKALDMSLATVKRRIRDGSLPTTKVGGVVLVDLARVRGLGADEIAQLAARVA
jgi:ferric-dicitrate binding protein FerR (iron transport regulator)